VLVLLTGGIYELRSWDNLRWHDVQTTFYDDRFGDSCNIKVIASTIREKAMLVLLMGGFTKYAIEMTSNGMMYIPSFNKIGWGVEKLGGDTHRDTQTQTARWCKPTIIFWK
jgi:hypothetical protein